MVLVTLEGIENADFWDAEMEKVECVSLEAIAQRDKIWLPSHYGKGVWCFPSLVFEVLICGGKTPQKKQVSPHDL